MCFLVAVIVLTNLGMTRVICYSDWFLSAFPPSFHKPLEICCNALNMTAQIWCTPYQYDSQSQGNTTLHHNHVLSGFKTERMQSACLKSLKSKGYVSKIHYTNQIYCLHFQNICIKNTLTVFFQVKPMKLSLVEKNILKSTGYKCYCTGMKQKCTQDHVTDQNGESWYQVSNHFYLECSKYLKCFCIIPSAFNVKEKHPSK